MRVVLMVVTAREPKQELRGHDQWVRGAFAAEVQPMQVSLTCQSPHISGTLQPVI
jgi:hypothetical protein